jgi:hypothetical protein
MTAGTGINSFRVRARLNLNQFLNDVGVLDTVINSVARGSVKVFTKDG